jgi:hypothetical protein
MQVKRAIKALQQLPKDAEICIQWYDQEDMSKMGIDGEETVSDEVWLEANRIFDKWEFSDMRYLLDDAISRAEENLGLKTGSKQ